MEGNIVPRKMFFTKGAGRANAKLAAFESALRSAGIEKFNLVRVSSIVPPNCEIISKESGLALLNPGGVTFLVLSRIESDEPNRLIAASIGVALPKDSSNYGYLSEYEEFGETDEIAGEKAEELAATMLASTLGIEFDVNQSWDEKEQVFKMSSKIVRTSDVTQSAVVGKDGMWTCAVAAAVFIL
jgi:arginine decarboxylase